MLAITESAAEAINALVSEGDMPDGSGARIASDGQGLELALVQSPSTEDTVVSDGGATVYLDETASQVLRDKTLDVERVTDGGEEQMRFAIVPGA